MLLPGEIVVQVRRQGDYPSRLDGILITLDTYIEGRYYWGTIVGLTDADGRATITAGKLEADFAADQETFPMDYKVPLAKCDPEITLRVIGGKQFRSFQATVKHQPLVQSWAQDLWLRANNAELAPTSVRARCDSTRPRLRIDLPLSSSARDT